MRTSKAFTLIELLITLSIVSVMACLSTLSFSSIYQKESAASITQQLFNGLNFARIESIKRNKRVNICGSSDFTQCDGNWNNGFLIYVDINADGCFSKEDKLLRVQQYKNHSINIMTGKRSYFQFIPNGQCTTRGTIKIKTTQGAHYAVVIYDSGRARIEYS